MVSPYPLICHLLDTAAMAATLWDQYLSPGVKHVIATSMGMADDEARRAITFWAGLHDIGKCMACFQVMDPDAWKLLNG
ncbi:hypothetical protein Misp01_67290 [Microtetraspora sp. NBRC 13810]|nr:hypothetical protein Misp01_67290 [Microtetraspora sp. NBRC 13810]